jgi:hypothetical protein
LISSVTRHIIFMFIAKMIIGVVTNLTDRLPRFKESRGNITMYKRVKEFEIRYSDEVSERENRELFEEGFSVVIIFLVGNYSNSRFWFRDKRLQERRRCR